MSQTFIRALKKVLDAEGVYSKDPNDPGNWTEGKVGKGILKGTKFGISAASYPNLDIINLTIEQAENIYRRDFWDRLNLSNIAIIQSPLVADMLFNVAVNCGTGNAGKFLQRVINALVIQEHLPITPQRLSLWQQAVLEIISNKALKVDGIIGPITLRVLKKIPHRMAIASGIFGEAYNHYIAGKIIYRAGWLNRIGNSYLT